MSDILRMDDYRGPAITVETGKAIHVYPLAYFQAVAQGEEVEPIPEDVLRVIVGEWLQLKQGYLYAASDS